VAGPEIAVAYTARDDPDLDLAGAWRVDVDRLHDGRASDLVDDRSHVVRRHASSGHFGGAPYTPRVDAGTLRDIAAPRYNDHVQALEAMVNVDCGSYSRAGVNAIADQCESRFRAHGWEVERRPHLGENGGSQLGDLVIGRLHGSGGPSILLVGHMDTVFDDGTVAERPFRIDGDVARGPGVSDMK